jgi:ADP-ribose pyrophosphatase YjhB (NUDIX family)
MVPYASKDRVNVQRLKVTLTLVLLFSFIYNIQKLHQKAQLNVTAKYIMPSFASILRETPPAISPDVILTRLEAFSQLMNDPNSRSQIHSHWLHSTSNLQPFGIVIPAGGKIPILNAFIVVSIIRHHLFLTETNLPISIAHYGSTELEDTHWQEFHTHNLNCTFIDLSQYQLPWYHYPVNGTGIKYVPKDLGYKIKTLALYAAPYKNVLMLDADSTPLSDSILELFTNPSYIDKGNLFWPDFWTDPVELWDILGLEQDSPWRNDNNNNSDNDNNIYQAESGQIVFNKEMHWDVLEWILFLNTHNYFTYAFTLGDKDTYRLAFHLASKHDLYNQVPHSPLIPLFKLPGGYYCLGMIQLEPLNKNGTNNEKDEEGGRPLFHHRTANSKFNDNPTYDTSILNKGPITHVTLPVRHPDTASMMLWGLPGGTVNHPLDEGVQWGFMKDQVVEITSLELNDVCRSDDKEEEEYSLIQVEMCLERSKLLDNKISMGNIAVLELPKANPLYKISSQEAIYYNNLYSLH